MKTTSTKEDRMPPRPIAISVLAGLFLLSICLPLSASAVERSSATLRLVAVVAPKAKIQIKQETVRVVASMADLDRGYLEIPGAAELLVWTNSKSGLTITARSDGILQGANGHSLPISYLSYAVGGGGFKAFCPGEQVVYVGRGQEVGSRVQIDYRLGLDWSVEPDTYTVNVTYTVTPN